MRRSFLGFALVGLHACAESAEPPARPPAVAAQQTQATARPAAPASVGSPPPAATPPAAASTWPPPAPAVETDWCIEGIPALDEETCFVLPDAPSTELLVYLHGIVPPERDSVQKTNFETVVANASRRAGVVALLPRGRQGLAGKARRGWWGWPTSALQHREHAAALVESLIERQRKLEALVGFAFERRFVAGSSSGAYFAAALALHGDIEADGFGAMSGGARAHGAEPAKLPPRPFYIGYGTADTVGPAAEALGASLRRAGWPVKIAKHPLGHGAKEIYLDEAFPFWRAAVTAR